MAQIKLAEYTFDNTIEADCLPNIKPDTITMTSSDSVDGNITTRTVYIDDTTMPTQINFTNKTSLLTVTYLNTDNKISWSGIFNGCTNLTSVNLTYSKGENVTSMYRAFNGCSKLEEIIGLSNFHVKIDDMDNLFCSCMKLKEIDLSGAIIENVYTGYYAFSHCREATKIKFPSNTIKMNREMWQMFAHCRVLEELDLSMFDTSNVTNMRQTFDGCHNLKSLNLSNFNTEKAGRMDNMFYDCWSLTSLDISNFNTKKVQYMGHMFYNTRIEKMILPENFVATSLKYGSNIFNNCKKLKELDLCNFKPSSCADVAGMFANCPLLETLDISNFDMSSVTSYSNMFQNTKKLKTIGMLFSDATTINKFVTVFRINNSTPLDIYYYDVDKTQLTQVSGINFIKYEYPKKLSLPPHIELHGLLDGTRDELDIKTGILTRRINKNEDGTLSILETPITEKIIINYNEPCEYGRILPTGAMDYYNVTTSEYLQNISSILLDGADVWNEVVEKENTVRLLYISPTDIKMKASGGLYCDNDLFPNIQDDSDIEHCRVHDTDNNKLYIYIDKNKLMSPDLIGFQVWLQENQFTVYYETSETIISIKDYSKLNPELARWEMIDCYVGGKIEYNGVIYPEISYQASSVNRFEIDSLEPNTQYTVYAENMVENPTINLGGATHDFVNGTSYTSGNNNVVVFNASPNVSNMMIIKGDVSNEVFPYFTGILNVVNPTVTSTNDTNTSTITQNIILRSTFDGIKDSYNIITGEYIRRVDENLQELSNPITTTLEPKTLLAYENGQILLSSESGLLPTLTYSVPSSNTFRLPIIKTRTQYTLKYPSASGTITIGNLTYNINSDSMVFTTPLTINGDKSAIVFSDDNPQDVMLIEGNYSKREIPLFSGVKSVSNPKITVLNNTTGESVLYECTQNIDLRSLPNGVSDTLDIVNKKLTQVTGIRPFQNGDYELDNVWTDGNYTVYGLSSPIVSNVEIETPVGYVNSRIYLASDYLIPVLNYRALSSNNFPLDLLLPNTTYTLYANTLVSGNYTLGGTHTGVFTGTEVISLGDITNNLLTFNGDLGLSNVMLIKGNTINSTFPFFRGLKSIMNYKLKVEGMNGELNELMLDDGIGLRACGNLVDSVDLMTCTLTRNLSELILNGSENWVNITSNENVDENYCLFAITVAGVKSSSNVNLACDKFNHYYQGGTLHNKEGIYTETNQIRLCVKKTTIGGDTVNNIKSWLQQNNTTIIYALQNSVIVPLENQWTTMPPTSYMNQTTITSEVVDSLKPIITTVIAITSLEQIVSNLEEQNAMLEEENVATMMALAEVYEMMFADVAVMSLNMDDELSMEDEIEPVPISSMGIVYIKLIRKGLKTIDQVPSFLQKEVMYGLQKGE